VPESVGGGRRHPLPGGRPDAAGGGRDRVAGLRIDYAALERAARGLGARLAALGAGPERVVAILLERSTDLVIAELAAWFAGAAFLPLDPADGEERLRFILEEARPAAVVAGPDRRALTGPSLAWVDPDERGAPAPTPTATPEPDALAYVIYTSGSTGRPKGVLVPHRGLLPLLEAQIEAFRLGPGKRSLFYLSPAFDASISDIGTSLLSGATLVIEPPSALAPGELPRTIARARITHVDLPPALLPLVAPEALPDAFETVIIGGEAAPVAAVRAYARRFRVINVYGRPRRRSAAACASATRRGRGRSSGGRSRASSSPCAAPISNRGRPARRGSCASAAQASPGATSRAPSSSVRGSWSTTASGCIGPAIGWSRGRTASSNSSAGSIGNSSCAGA
jgi:non-ribosomal peptide synthetase component F